MLAFFLLSFGLPPASACSFRTCLLSKGTAVPAPPGAAAPWVRPGPPAPQSTPVRNYCVWAGIAYTLLLGLGLSQATPSIQVALLEGLLQGFSSSPSRRATQSIQVALLEGLLQGFSSSPSRRATPRVQVALLEGLPPRLGLYAPTLELQHSSPWPLRAGAGNG